MRVLIISLLLPVLLAISPLSQADILSFSGDGDYNGSVTGDDGWRFNQGFGEMDFWNFTVAEETSLSVNIFSDIVFGVGLYSGELQTDPGFMFSNAGDFSGLFGESMSYVAGTDPFTPFSGNSLTNIILSAGSYTLALGGNDAGFDMFSDFSYMMNISTQATTAVPEPAMGGLFALALSLLLIQRKRLLN
ncbi:PEP-CTERM sorting domain-containing protein [Lacimicrobium alkaliphilum]|uniref:PEP-CTERM protein-sorting domain-containing protein n=1 Tax=Lacimicrobium alkaliphilum TaxID=1526571 RepID=A0ABQ1RQ44_9ALTE|nr:PEP-CTERM sorting domain-containing protein [Lacimicrobium alkaliphilum]GGD77650.1 hypothetical protein GCM10011357_35910 [Lacimicrobium alkaliphilum]